jgi:hypothetical protein
LHPADLAALAEAVADRVVERLRDRPPPELLDAAEVARRFGIGPRWVREHADKLGAVRVGDGPRPRLRFDPEKVAAALTARSQSKGSLAPDRPRHRRRSRAVPSSSRDGLPLLPVRGLSG